MPEVCLVNYNNVDERMREYFWKHGQPLKPIHSGYKIWAINLLGGYLYNLRIYQGVRSKNQYSEEFGLGSSVVLDLMDALPSDNKYKLYFDNYVSSATLAEHMKGNDMV